MKATLFLALAGCLAAGSAFAGPGAAYVNRPPVVISPDLTSPWVIQIAPGKNHAEIDIPTYYRGVVVGPSGQAGAVVGPPAGGVASYYNGAIDRSFLPAIVDYRRAEPAGTVVVDTGSRYLYLVLPGGKAMRYGVGVGREGFAWSGTAEVGRKAEWPTWTPPPEMVKRDPNARPFANGMPGGPDNPLGARAMYLYRGGNDTLYRIHGTSEPWTIGQAVSSGCIRMRNEDVIDLYNRVQVGTRVVVI